MPWKDRIKDLRRKWHRFLLWQLASGVSRDELERNGLHFLNDNEPLAPNTPRLPPTPPPPLEPPVEWDAPFDMQESAATNRNWWVPPLPPVERSAANDSVWWPLPPTRAESSAADKSSVSAYETPPAATAPGFASDRGSIENGEALEERPFKRHKGSGKLGSNGIRLREPSCAEAPSAPMPRGNPKFPDPEPAWSPEEIEQKFRDGTYSRPPKGFWSGGIIEQDTHVLWSSPTIGPNGGESDKVTLYHGVVRGMADPQTLIVF